MNSYMTICCVLALTASIKADGGLGLGGLVYAPGHASADYYAYPRYAFEYAVNDPHTGDNKAQWEKRDGDVVKGAYSLVEPDGSLRVVDYWADDKSGFNAVVKRIGPNLHPAAIPAAPIYKAPIPVLAASAIVSPVSIGPIAKYSALASAPLITGPLGLGGHGGAAASTANLIKGAPIVVSAPIAPIIKSAPILGPLPIISAPAPLLKGPVGISAVSLGDGLLKGPLGGYGNNGLGLAKGGYDNYGLGLVKGEYDNYGLGIAKGGYDNYGLGLAKEGYDNYGLRLAKGGYDNYGLGLAKGGYDNYGLGLAKGGYDNYGLGLAKGGYDNYGLSLTKGGYDNYGLGLAKGEYDSYGLGLAKGGYDNYGLGLAKGGYDNYGLGLAKGPLLPLGGAWNGLGWKH